MNSLKMYLLMENGDSSWLYVSLPEGKWYQRFPMETPGMYERGAYLTPKRKILPQLHGTQLTPKSKILPQFSKPIGTPMSK